MGARSLGIILSSLEGFENPKPELEQWATPGEIAEKMVSLADLRDKKVLDLGAGTGILSIAASLSGARSVVAVEIDPASAKILERNVRKLGLENIETAESDVAGYSGQADAVLMNPPFGAQDAARHADRIFLETAFRCAPEVFSLHLSKTRSFISRFSGARGFEDAVLGTFRFPLKASFGFHRKERKIEEVDYHRLWRRK